MFQCVHIHVTFILNTLIDNAYNDLIIGENEAIVTNNSISIE